MVPVKMFVFMKTPLVKKSRVGLSAFPWKLAGGFDRQAARGRAKDSVLNRL
jgi:hypothetical protein